MVVVVVVVVVGRGGGLSTRPVPCSLGKSWGSE